MYALLLVLGALTGALGLALVATGVTSHDTALGSEITIPGTIATIGGFVLIGLALAVRELQRIERALAARPMPRPARPLEAPAAAAQSAGEPRIPFPPNPRAEASPQSPPAGTVNPPEASEGAALERLREKFPTLVRLERAPLVEEAHASLSPQARPEPVEEVAAVLKNGSAIGSERAALPPEFKARKAGATGSVFEAFWPSGQRRRSAQFAATAAAVPAAAALASEPAPESEIAPANEPAAAAPEEEMASPEVASAAPVTILKSGVVEGMAYALYSDGSIEAQLPQGRLRFGSITELRNHIESAS